MLDFGDQKLLTLQEFGQWRFSTSFSYPTLIFSYIKKK